MNDIAEAVSSELAHRDLSDIKTLRELEAFNRYFMRRLRDKRKKLDQAFRNDPMPHEDREVHRRLVNEYDELINLLDRDESSCQRTLRQ